MISVLNLIKRSSCGFHGFYWIGERPKFKQGCETGFEIPLWQAAEVMRLAAPCRVTSAAILAANGAANKGTSTARVVASYLIPKGAARTTPVK
jgi:hypothetical protein